MINSKSIYALNKKDPDAIVYPTADGKLVRVTREYFPSEEAFLAFKSWSDEDFHEEEKHDHRESNHTLAADALSDAALAVPATVLSWNAGMNGGKTKNRFRDGGQAQR